MTGPLVVSAVNPRYFTIASAGAADRDAVYLTGSHVNNNFHDGMGTGSACAEAAERFDYDAYLDFLKDHGHNFIRLWRWEHVRSQLADGAFHACMSPQPWPRVGPGTATDGSPKFDLSVLDEAYFERLRQRISAADQRGIYVSVMLFEGFGLHLTPPPDNVEGHPFHADNNVSGISIGSIVDYQVLPLDPRIQKIQEAYIRKVVDTVQDLPNVLYEVVNESSGDSGESVQMPDGSTNPTPIGDSTGWQYWVIDFIKQYELESDYQAHPVGMTMQYPVPDQSKVNDPLFSSRAEWISPGFDDQVSITPGGDGPPPSKWLTDPPASDGTKVVISDTDHYSPMAADALWAWKSFLRGCNPILFDLGIVSGVNPPDPSSGSPSFESLEPARLALGDTRRFAQRMDLLAMEPRGDLSPTGYVLAKPGREYLVLKPGDERGPISVALKAGAYSVEWHSVTTREASTAPAVTVESDGDVEFTAPFGTGAAVLYLARRG